MNASRVKTQFAEFEFDRVTGELTRLGIGDIPPSPSSRLPPQPSQLLELLLTHYPDVVSHQTIQQELWPGIGADCERNLHFCIRQIRAALNDSASNPSFVETIPRRGYRWIAKPIEVEEKKPIASRLCGLDLKSSCVNPDKPTGEDVPLIRETGIDADPGVFSEPQSAALDTTHPIQFTGSAESFGTPTASSQLTKHWWYLLASVAAIMALAVIFFWPTANKNPKPVVSPIHEKPRIAIMPFVTTQPEFATIGEGSIALNILQRLEFSKLDVVGPTSTSEFDGRSQSLEEMVSKFRIDLIANGRFYQENGKPVMLAEVIRASDGAHIWVERFDPTSPPEYISQQTVDAINRIASELRNGPR